MAAAGSAERGAKADDENQDLAAWTMFFAKVKTRPPAFYKRCVERLAEQDFYEPDDLSCADVDSLARQLERVGATSGEIAFLRQAVSVAKGHAGGDVAGPPTATAPQPAASERGARSGSLAAPPAQSCPPAAAPAPQVRGGTSHNADSPWAPHGAGPPIVSLVVPGTEDPSKLMQRGGLEIQWKSKGRPVRTVKRFREQPMRRVVDASLALPTLYLHFLDKRFLAVEGEFDTALRSGNDNSELQIVLPDRYVDGTFDLEGELVEAVSSVVRFLVSQGEAQVSTVKTKAGAFGPANNFKLSASPSQLYFQLRTSRPKAGISLDKTLFGIPEAADLYLFAENHVSVNYMSQLDREAFELCIAELPDALDEDLRLFAVFLKIFYEGGFGYNHKQILSKGYLPQNVGIAGLGVVPAFEGQMGIRTGYPYVLDSRFFRFCDTVPVTIRAISEMSPRHGRYGLCFTRCVFVWEDDALEREGMLNFSSLLPHGGFYYIPAGMQEHHKLGGLVYAFGEVREALEQPVSSDVVDAGRENSTAGSSAAAPAAPRSEIPVCVICLYEEAVMATLPCGHRAFCATCGPMGRGHPCPVCRAAVNDLLRVY